MTSFAPTIYLSEHVKYFSYGGGPKIAWRARKWEPWMHAIVGGAHIQPQTTGSRNGFDFMAGGRAAYPPFPPPSRPLGRHWWWDPVLAPRVTTQPPQRRPS